MKNTGSILALLIFAAFFALVSCKKDNSNIITLSYADTAKVTAVQKGKIINITLSIGNNPYYAFGNWEYDTTILNIVNHTHVAPPAKVIGSGDTDTWTFNTLATGTTPIKLKSSGFGGKNYVLFNGTIEVK